MCDLPRRGSSRRPPFDTRVLCRMVKLIRGRCLIAFAKTSSALSRLLAGIEQAIDCVARHRPRCPAVKMLTQLLANSDSFRRQIIEQASPPQQKLLQALNYGAEQSFAPYGTFGPSLQPGTSKGNLQHEFMTTQITDTKVPTPRQNCRRALRRTASQKYLGQRYLPH